MNLRSAVKALLVLVLALPVAQMVLLWVRGLLTAMGDPVGGAVIGHVGTACQATWALCVVALLIVVSFIVLDESSTDGEE